MFYDLQDLKTYTAVPTTYIVHYEVNLPSGDVLKMSFSTTDEQSVSAFIGSNPHKAFVEGTKIQIMATSVLDQRGVHISTDAF